MIGSCEGPFDAKEACAASTSVSLHAIEMESTLSAGQCQQNTHSALPAQMSDAKFASLGALGAGLLTGTALAVILPEGFHAFQAAQAAAGVAHLFAFPSWGSQQPCT